MVIGAVYELEGVWMSNHGPSGVGAVWSVPVAPVQLSVMLVLLTLAADNDPAQTTVTVKEQLAVWPPLVVAEQVTIVVPIGNTLPDGGTQSTETFPQVCRAVTLKNTRAPAGLVQLFVMFGGHVMTSGDGSMTLNGVWQQALLPD
jgi:hypothetical protein